MLTSQPSLFSSLNLLFFESIGSFDLEFWISKSLLCSKPCTFWLNLGIFFVFKIKYFLFFYRKKRGSILPLLAFCYCWSCFHFLSLQLCSWYSLMRRWASRRVSGEDLNGSSRGYYCMLRGCSKFIVALFTMRIAILNNMLFIFLKVCTALQVNRTQQNYKTYTQARKHRKILRLSSLSDFLLTDAIALW